MDVNGSNDIIYVINYADAPPSLKQKIDNMKVI